MRRYHGGANILSGYFLRVTFPIEPYSDEECCSDDSVFDPPTPESQCRAIDVTKDGFFKRHGVKCLKFVRSKGKLNAGVRQQINEATAFLDASNIYGNSKEKGSELRAFDSGKMKVGPKEETPRQNPREYCNMHKLWVGYAG